MNEDTSFFSLSPSLAEPLKCGSFRHESHGDLGESLCRLHTVLHSGPVRTRHKARSDDDVGSQGSAKPTTFDLVRKEVARNCSHKRIIPLTCIPLTSSTNDCQATYEKM